MKSKRETEHAIEHETGHKNMLHLIELRWLAIVGQVLAIALAALLFGLQLPLPQLLAVLVCLAAFNLGSHLRWHEERHVTHRELLAAMLVDVLALSVLLYFTGGVSNPFVCLYLLQVILGAVLLKPSHAWAIVFVTALCLLVLAVFNQPLRLTGDRGFGYKELFVAGVLVGYLLNAGLLVYFVTRIASNMQARDQALAAMQERALEEENLVRMGLLASGAAHELGTPLSTMSVVLNDWQRMPVFATNPVLQEELADVQQQLQRCKQIVSEVLLSAGQTRGEHSRVQPVAEFFATLVQAWQGRHAHCVLDYQAQGLEHLSMVADTTLQQAVVNVLDNAAEASPQWVGMAVQCDESHLQISVHDAGPGFAPPVQAQLGKPYNTTKTQGGSGLGLFLVSNVLRQLGGSLQVLPRSLGPGTTVVLSFPRAALWVQPLAMPKE